MSEMSVGEVKQLLIKELNCESIAQAQEKLKTMSFSVRTLWRFDIEKKFQIKKEKEYDKIAKVNNYLAQGNLQAFAEWVAEKINN